MPGTLWAGTVPWTLAEKLGEVGANGQPCKGLDMVLQFGFSEAGTETDCKGYKIFRKDQYTLKGGRKMKHDWVKSKVKLNCRPNYALANPVGSFRTSMAPQSWPASNRNNQAFISPSLWLGVGLQVSRDGEENLQLRPKPKELKASTAHWPHSAAENHGGSMWHVSISIGAGDGDGG